MSSPAATRVAFIGLGHMGGHMCRNLINAGFPVSANDQDPEALARAADGARPAQSVADCAGEAEILITSLPGPPQVEEVLCGAHGAIAALIPGSLVVEHQLAGGRAQGPGCRGRRRRAPGRRPGGRPDGRRRGG